MADLDQEGQAVRIAKGGRGGKGNISVKRLHLTTDFRLKIYTRVDLARRERKKS